MLDEELEKVLGVSTKIECQINKDRSNECEHFVPLIINHQQVERAVTAVPNRTFKNCLL